MLNNHLRKCRKQGMTVYFGTLNFSGPVYPKEAAKTVTKFQQLLKPFGQWRWYMETTPADTTTIHIHYVLTSYDRVPEATIRSLWHKAKGTSNQRDVNHQSARSCKAVSEYITGHDQRKYRVPLFDRGLGVRTCGGSRHFFPMSVDERYKEISRNFKAFIEFKEDPDMWQHVQSGIDLHAHYLAVVDSQYEAYLDHAFDRRATVKLPDEDWSTVFAPTTAPTAQVTAQAPTGANIQDNSTPSVGNHEEPPQPLAPRCPGGPPQSPLNTRYSPQPDPAPHRAKASAVAEGGERGSEGSDSS